MATAKKKDDDTQQETVKLAHPDAPDGYVREVRAEEVNMWRSQGWHKPSEDAETAPEPSNPEPAPAAKTSTAAKSA